MKKFIYLWLAVSLLSGCASMKAKLAKAEIQKYKLADGKTVLVDMNVIPTSDWQCSELGQPYEKDWQMVKFKSQFDFSGPIGYLSKKAIDSANEQKIDPNYINLTVPNTSSIGTGNVSFNLHPTKKAIARFYSCKKINPDQTIGVHRHTGVTIN